MDNNNNVIKISFKDQVLVCDEELMFEYLKILNEEFIDSVEPVNIQLKYLKLSNCEIVKINGKSKELPF